MNCQLSSSTYVDVNSLTIAIFALMKSLFTLACFGYHAIGVRYTVIYFSQPACIPLLKYDEPIRFSLPLDTTHLRYSAISVGFVQLSCRTFIFSFNQG